MGIIYEEKSRQFHLYNDKISYIMTCLPNGQMGQLYYGIPGLWNRGYAVSGLWNQTGKWKQGQLFCIQKPHHPRGKTGIAGSACCLCGAG